jgi:hypothetical protein
LTLFKLELNASKEEMLKRARATLQAARADLAVVNTFSEKVPYEAFILDRGTVFYKINSKQGLAKKLLHLISTKIS